jgi:hypothetical protein
VYDRVRDVIPDYGVCRLMCLMHVVALALHVDALTLPCRANCMSIQAVRACNVGFKDSDPLNTGFKDSDPLNTQREHRPPLPAGCFAALTRAQPR